MGDLLKEIFTAPLATVFIIAGILFLFIAVIGNISGKIEPGVKGRIASGVLGLVFVLIGLTIHLTQKAPQIPFLSQEPIKLDKVAKFPQTSTTKATEIPRKLITSAPSTVDKEPNNHITAANLISVGTTIHGSISTNKDKDFYKFKALSNTTRIILRKLSLRGFPAVVVVYNAVENRIAEKTKFSDQPVTLSFESNTGSIYYIKVNSYNYSYHGDYELVIRNE